MPIRRLDAFLLGAAASLGLAWGASNGGLPAAQLRAAPDDRARPAASPRSGAAQAANSPAAIPARGWWDVLKRVFSRVSEDNVLAQAAGVTFYSLLALFPALASLVSLYGLFADPATIEKNLGAVSGVVPGGGMDIITQQVHSLASSSSGALGVGLVIGLATSLWSANAGVKSIFDALNVVYQEHEKRSFLFRTVVSFAFTIGGLLFIILALAGVVVLPALLTSLGLEDTLTVVLQWVRWPLLLVVVAALLALLYRYGPSRELAKWRWVSPGGAVAAIAWLIVSVAFSWYVQNFGSYNKTYGSLGAVVGFMTWIWLSTTVVLVGGELNAELEHETAKDTTRGPERPMGSRGAVKADTVAG